MDNVVKTTLTILATFGVIACETRTNKETDPPDACSDCDAQVNTRDGGNDRDADIDAGNPDDGGERCPADGNCTVPVAPVNECAEGLDDCDDPHAGCIDTASGFTCVCGAGYEGSGHGASSCMETGLCGVDHGGCSANAKCFEYSGQAFCSCPPGFDGSGKGADGCKDVDECAAGAAYACGTGATACSNKVGSLECTCEAPSVATRDARRCKTDGWVGLELIAADTEWVYPSRDWAVSMAPSDQNLITYVIDGMVTKSYVQGVGYESRGGASAGWTKELRNGMDQAGNGFAISIASPRDTATAEKKWSVWGSRMVRGAGWLAPAPINPNQPGVPSAPALAVAGNGLAVAAWEQAEGDNSNVFASVANLADGFGAPTALEVQDDNASQPQVAINSAGAALAVWLEGANGQRRVHASRYSGGKWASAAAVPHMNAEDAERPQIVLDKNNCGYVAWREGNGDVKHVFGARYTKAKGFVEAERLDTEATSAGEPRLALDGKGNVTVVWSQGAQVFVLHQEICAGTATPQTLDGQGLVDPAHVRVAESASGNGFVVWSAPKEGKLWVSRRTAAGVWLDPKELSDGVYNAEVAADDQGNAMVLYQWVRPWALYLRRFEATP